jgi:hypothetical protein
MSDGERSGLSPWLVGLFGFLLYRRGRRRGDERRAGGGGGGRRGPLRDVRLPDGRDAIEVTASMFEPESDGTDAGTWRRITLDGTDAMQAAFEATLTEVAPGARSAEDVPVLLMPLGTRRRVNAVDVYATGGRLGQLPEHAVRSVGESIRATHLADDRPCAVRARIAPQPSGALGAEVLLPETFTPGGSSTGR